MALNLNKARACLQNFDFKQLFIEELGWNQHKVCVEIFVDGVSFSLQSVSEKCGMAVFICNHGSIPEYRIRRKIERQVAKNAHEHIIIFVDTAQSKQIWQWVKCERGKPTACREHAFTAGQTGEALVQKLRALGVSLAEEETITLPDVTGRARRAFDVERVTRRFYDLFKSEHAAFLKFLAGIPDEDMQRWYVSVMLNRIMFIYFIQKKGFLSGDSDYLKNKLTQSKATFGKDRFYKDLLCPLFFDGFAKQKEDRPKKSRELLGDVPYLNGGIFMPHQIEQLYGKIIQIPDKAFEKLFEFFDAYNWHLDERPLRADNEINPDVLGYIFEKYINQKQMGAYYTKEDITEYISKNTIIPFLFDAAREKCKVAFEGPNSIWHLLQEDPDRYIYEAVRRGVITPGGDIIPEGSLPDFVQKGMHDPNARMFNRDYNLGLANVPGPDGANLALPTETWREYVARRERCLELRQRLIKGEINSINDLITFNLDIRQFAQDVIDSCEGPELLVAFWKAIFAITVLDPTCGSGAFLFAALSILEALYDACLARMNFFLEEWGENGRKNHPNYFKLFTETLEHVNKHPNHRHFVLKSIIVNNLYGVDIMEEAVEICKLRLFLKLVAQIDRADQIEPLPDIDFNIRAGNTLVGFATKESVRASVDSVQAATLGKKPLQKKLFDDAHTQQKLLFGEEVDALKKIDEQADEVDRLFIQFRKQQTKLGGKVTAEDKDALQSRLKSLTDELDRFLAAEYGVDPNKKTAFDKWHKTHQPFHWFAEFYGILKDGGFDVVIGNPPFVEYSNRRVGYKVIPSVFTTLNCGNIYSYVAESCFYLCRHTGSFSFIMPSASLCTPRMESLMQGLQKRFYSGWISIWDERPSKLFDGVDQQLSVHIYRHNGKQSVTAVTAMRHWLAEERDFIFQAFSYLPQAALTRVADVLPKVETPLELKLLNKIYKIPHKKSEFFISDHAAGSIFYRNAGGRYWRLVKSFPTYFRSETGASCSSTEKIFKVAEENVFLFTALFSSTLFYWFWRVVSNCRHLTDRELLSFPIADTLINKTPNCEIVSLAKEYEKCLKQNKFRQTTENARSGKVVQDIYRIRAAKQIIDKIDSVLATHYALSIDEIDFIVNYDIKYRMGLGVDNGDDE
jgi:hypothetical protein